MKTKVFKYCRNCDSRFKQSRHWQIFCSDKCRKNFEYAVGEFCFYCGEPGVSKDHVHPVSARSGYKRTFEGQETVFCCKECNSTLGGKVFDSVENRVQYLITRYVHKYKLWKSIVWTEIELEEIGPTLRSAIKTELASRMKAEKRVTYLRAVKTQLEIRIADGEEEENGLVLAPQNEDEIMCEIDRFSGELLEPEEN